MLPEPEPVPLPDPEPDPLPVPVPAVLNIAEAYGIALRLGTADTELVTPTGIALAAAFRTCSALPAAFRVVKTGIGFGTREIGRANCLRAMLIEPAAEVSGDTADEVFVLEANVDDATGEELGVAMEALFSAGARDCHFMPCFMKKNRPSPKVFIGYDRTAYAGIEDPEFRITFDRNIRYRLHDLDLRSGDHGDPVTDDDTVVMEVKIKDAMPLWLVPILSSNRIYPGSFSKYGACYERFIAREAFKPSVFLQAQEVREAEKIKETEKIKITEEMNRTEEVKEVKKAKKTGERRRSCSAVLSGVLSPSLHFSSVLSSRWHSAS